MKIVRSAALVVFAALSCAMQFGGVVSLENGVLDHEDDARWTIFSATKLTVDEAKGEYRASFGPSLAKMEGQTYKITGYMLPVETSFATAHFILTRRSSSCPFCPPNEPTEAIEVVTAVPVKYRQTPVTVEGNLHLFARTERGLFYKLDKAKVSQ